MKYSSSQFMQAFNMTYWGSRKFAKALCIPFENGFFDTSLYYNISQSIFLSINTNRLAYYSMPQLGKLINKDRKTVIKLIRRNNIPIQKIGRKFFVLLIDLHKFHQLQGKM